MSEEKEPEDLGVRIGTKEEALWNQVLKNAQASLKQAEQELIVQKAVVELAEQKIAKEQEKSE